MNLDSTQNTTTILKELGDRITFRRISIRLTQQEAALKAGVSLRTWIAMENGKDVRLSTLITGLQALDMLDNLNVLLPERTISPVDFIKLQGKERKRVRKSKKEADKSEQSSEQSSQQSNKKRLSTRKPSWKWGNEK